MIDLRELGWNEFFEKSFEPYRAKGLRAARVVREHRKGYLVCTGDSDVEAEMAGKIAYRAKSKAEYPTVGDWVAVRELRDEGRAFIEAVLERKSKFSRKSAGLSEDEQVVAVNIDTVFLVTDAWQDFNIRRLERYLVLGWDSGARPVVVINKSDLCEDTGKYVEQVREIAPEVDVRCVSAIEGDGIAGLKEYMGSGETVAMLGSSGVGKSTIINAILGMERQEVKDVRAEDGRGRHTTTHRELIVLPEGGAVIDNPGMRELHMRTDERGLGRAFDDIQEIAEECKFRDCMHENEPGCAVKAAVEEGRLDEERLANFFRLREELELWERRDSEKLSRGQVRKRIKHQARRARRRKR
ncbi:Putative ribosome biogenesis GTPase RsgA [Anaerohalosphaera lusitana]|uniref:Small ribosomal subunit biogenesis GTPase RsgA n=1 Tax=Anaerohalosphaera lusitana TaxID=1936003 RepID=A0A1U9NJL8_9BACT|nr:Putative ribosome biogenesis GTPase RsgA [Anaerohalosphaera lusitana]